MATITNEQLEHASMKMIASAGDARLACNEAVKMVKEGEFKNARDLLAAANDKLIMAHKAQTDIIQASLEGEFENSSLLFTHAQDTFMCIKTEYLLLSQIIDLFEIVFRKEGLDNEKK